MSRLRREKDISFDEERQVYYLYMDLGRDELGRRNRRYGTYPTLAAARRARDDFLAQRSRQKLLRPTELTLEQWLEEWMRDVVVPNRAETTVYGYRKMLDNHLLPALGAIPLQRLSPLDLQRYYADLMREKGLCANTVRRHHDLLSASLHCAVKQDLLLRSPTERVEPPRVVPKETRYYTAEDLRKLYRLVEGDPLETVVHLAGSLGLRREEICGLRWESVDFKLRRIHIREARTAVGSKIVSKETKNRSSTRVLHMGQDIYRVLRQEQQHQKELKRSLGPDWPDSGLVAVDERGAPLSPNRLSVAFSEFVQDSGLPPLTLHGLRHSFATVASAQGVPLFDIGKALGHASPSTTGRVYTHLVDQLHTEALDKVAKALR